MTLAAFFARAGSATFPRRRLTVQATTSPYTCRFPKITHTEPAVRDDCFARRSGTRSSSHPGFQPVGLSWPAGMIAGMVCVLAIADQRSFGERSPMVSRWMGSA